MRWTVVYGRVPWRACRYRGMLSGNPRGTTCSINQMADKITFETVRRIASALPGVEESKSYRGPALKVGGRMLACPAINKSAEPNSLVLSIDLDQREAMLAEAPDTYYITDHYADYSYVLVRLSRVDPEVLHDLVHAAWKFVTAARTRERRGIAQKKRRTPTH